MDTDKSANNINNSNKDTTKLTNDIDIGEISYKSLYNFMLDAYAVHQIILDESGNPIDYKFIMVNDAFESITGINREDAVGKLGSEIFPVDAKWIQKLGRVAISGEPIRFTDYLSGYNKYFEVSAFSPEPGKFASIFRDITEQKLAENKLKESREAYSTLINTLSQKIFLKDSNSKYISCNSSFAKDLGIDQDNIKGMTDYDFFPPELATKYIKDDKQVIDSGKPIERVESYISNNTEYTIQTVKTPLIDSSSNSIGIIGIFWDITEKTKAVIALKESEEKYRSLMENAPEAICIIDTHENARFIDGNTKLEKIFGLPLKEIYKLTFRDFSPKTQEGGVLSEELGIKYIEGAISGKEMIYEWNVLNNKDNSLIPCEVRLNRLNSSDSRYLRGSIIDVSERKYLEEKLRQSEKMQVIGQLAGGIAHDFNNQLGGIMGYADLLSLKLTDSTLKGYADGIITSAERAASLTQQLLAFSRKGKYLSEIVDIHAVISEVISLLTHSIDKIIQIEQRLNACPATVSGDPTQLQNAILNIALNSRDSMPNGGKITFETENVNLSKEYCINHAGGIPSGDYLQITITDTGCGMDKATSEHIFEPFFTTKKQGKGTGMGLASVYGTLKNHGGAINVYSELGHGTVCRLFLPTTSSEIIESKSISKAPPITQSANILLVDDEDIARRIATAMLEDVGYNVFSCKNGLEAIEHYTSDWRDIDLVILDMIMPHLGGHDTFKSLKAINPDIKALLSSGYTINGEAQAIIDDGVIDFIGKPFRQQSLLSKVISALK